MAKTAGRGRTLTFGARAVDERRRERLLARLYSLGAAKTNRSEITRLGLAVLDAMSDDELLRARALHLDSIGIAMGAPIAQNDR